MSTAVQPAVATETPCKCCGALASPYGSVDFHKNCESRRRQVLEPSGVLIRYHRCPWCGFVFTADFDGCTLDDFRLIIYNDSYVLVDPDYRDERPRANAATLCNLFPDPRPGRVLDYGGGEGKLAELLRASDFPHVETYDPFVPRFAARPTGRFDCISCFEVLEHTTDPAAVFAELDQLLADPGLVMFSTLLQPADMALQGLNWWYASPRNGHVSLYTMASLQNLAQPLGLTLASFNEGFHLLLRGRPGFARHFFG
jgi:2-polyprenyl-6-hydroxyphenyl methylase/3-demethylubiquinone-9 3-methyltransferase